MNMRSAIEIILGAAASLPLLGQLTDGVVRNPPGDWQMYNRDLAGTRYSPLTQINSTNVVRLRKAWAYLLRTEAERAKPRAEIGTFSEATPIVANGVMYFPAGSRVLALDPETGKEIWRYQYKGQVNKRGVAYWPGDWNSAPRIFVTAGTKMIALNAQNGQL